MPKTTAQMLAQKDNFESLILLLLSQVRFKDEKIAARFRRRKKSLALKLG